MRGKPRVALACGQVRTLTIRRKSDRWYAAIAVRYPAAALQRNQAYPDRAVGLDAGCKALVATSDADLIDNPRHLRSAQAKLRHAQKELSRKKKGSNRRQKARHKVARLHELVANRRKDHLHQLSAAIVFLYSFIAVEGLALRSMTRSARGTLEKPGRNVRQKAGLNRSLLDASIGLLYQMLAYKAVEAGGQLMDVIPNGTSQNCFWCGKRVPKDLSVRTHQCPHCGFTADRDYNAALNILLLGLARAGWEPSEAWSRISAAVRRETSTLALLAA